MIGGLFLITATTSFQKVFGLLKEQAISKALENAFSVCTKPCHLSPVPVPSSPNHTPASLWWAPEFSASESHTCQTGRMAGVIRVLDFISVTKWWPRHSKMECHYRQPQQVEEKKKIVYSLSHQIMSSIYLWKTELKKVSKINHGSSGLRSSLLYNPIHVGTYKHWNFTYKKFPLSWQGASRMLHEHSLLVNFTEVACSSLKGRRRGIERLMHSI